MSTIGISLRCPKASTACFYYNDMHIVKHRRKAFVCISVVVDVDGSAPWSTVFEAKKRIVRESKKRPFPIHPDYGAIVSGES